LHFIVLKHILFTYLFCIEIQVSIQKIEIQLKTMFIVIQKVEIQVYNSEKGNASKESVNSELQI